MIEVEKKVAITDEFLNHVSHYGVYLEEINLHDTYFDTVDYAYTTQNMWLRKRLNAFELKKAVKRNDRTIDRYEEITDHTRILQVLHIQDLGELEASLEQAKIVPFASFKTTRKKYRLHNFNIDIDCADFGDLIYQVAEVECMVESEGEIEQAESNIHSFLSQFGVDPTQKLRGKLIHYLFKTKPHHFAALQQAGVV